MRWLTHDPIGYEGGSNLYEYVGGNPVGYVDPSGLSPIGRDIGAALGTALGGYGGGLLGAGIAVGSGVGVIASPGIVGIGVTSGGLVGGIVGGLLGDAISELSASNTCESFPIFVPNWNDSNMLSKGGKQNIRDSGLENLTIEEIIRSLKDGTLDNFERKRLDRELKARKYKNKRKRKSGSGN